MASVSVPRAWIEDGSVPPVCIVCGRRARDRYFPGVGAPSLAWVLFSPLLGLLSFWVYVLLPGRAGDGEAGLPFCKKHRRYWPRRGWFIVIGFAGVVATFVAAAAAGPPAAPGAEQQVHPLFGLGACWVVIFLPTFLIVHLSAVRPIGNSRRSVRLAGVDPDFVDALEDDDDDDDAGPPRGRSR
jgi:hypothetical protein